MNVKFPVFVICVKAILCLLLHDLHDCTFKKKDETSKMEIIFDRISSAARYFQGKF